MMKSVKNEENMSPKMMAEPSACHMALERVTGMIPSMVQSEVMHMASSLDFPASMIASSPGMPLRRWILI